MLKCFYSHCLCAVPHAGRTTLYPRRYASPSPFIYSLRDADIGIDALELMFVGIGVTTLTVVALIYTRINAKRDAAAREHLEKGIKLSPAELRALGDRAPDFRYTL